MSMRRLFGISCACFGDVRLRNRQDAGEGHIPFTRARTPAFSKEAKKLPTIKSSSLRWGATQEGWSVDYSSQGMEQRL